MKKSIKKNRKIIITFALCLVAMLSIGRTVAFFTDTAPVKNMIGMGKVEANVEETIITNGKKDIGVSLTEGSVESWIRLYVGLPTGNKENADDSQGKILFDKIVNDKNKESWKYNSIDGYYYYTKSVKPTDETILLFDSITWKQTINKDQVPANVDIIVYAEAVQRNNMTETVYEAFGIKEDSVKPVN